MRLCGALQSCGDDAVTFATVRSALFQVHMRVGLVLGLLFWLSACRAAFWPVTTS